MALLKNERQEKAAALARELGKMNDVWVTSPMPLDDNQRLRVQISDAVRNEVMQILRDWGWDPICISILPRVCSTGLLGACLYEIDLPRERQPIIDDRTIPRDEGGKREMSRECQAIVDAWYGVKKR